MPFYTLEIHYTILYQFDTRHLIMIEFLLLYKFRCLDTAFSLSVVFLWEICHHKQFLVEKNRSRTFRRQHHIFNYSHATFSVQVSGSSVIFSAIVVISHSNKSLIFSLTSIQRRFNKALNIILFFF